MIGVMDVTQPWPSDDDLLGAVRRGDADALEALVTRYEPRVYRFGLAMCRDAEDAHDVTQDTFMSMVRGIQGFRAESTVSTWLYAITRHACLKKRRRTKSAPHGESSLESLTPRERDALRAATPSPEDTVAAQERRALLRAAIRSLEPAQREVLVLRDVEGLSAAEAATVLGLSVAALKSRLHRARLAVRAALEPVLGAGLPKRDGPCPDVLTHLSTHLEGDLAPDTCARLEAHVAACPQCHAACESLKGVLAQCRDDSLPVVPESTQRAVRQAIRACLAEHGTSSPSRAQSDRVSRHEGDR